MDKLTKGFISEWDSKFSGIDYAVWMDKKMNKRVHKKFKAFIVKWLSKVFKAGVEEGRKEEEQELMKNALTEGRPDYYMTTWAGSNCPKCGEKLFTTIPHFCEGLKDGGK